MAALAESCEIPHTVTMSDTSERRRGWVPQGETFGDRLYKLRKSTGMNKAEFAIHCGLIPNSYGDWESDIRFPRRLDEVIGKIVDATDVSRDWLMWGDTPSDLGIDPSGWDGIPDTAHAPLALAGSSAR